MICVSFYGIDRYESIFEYIIIKFKAFSEYFDAGDVNLKEDNI